MVPEPSTDVELVAASLRADRTDTGVFVEVLAAKLEQALPDFTEVERSGGRFGRPRRVDAIRVNLGERSFRLVRSGSAIRTEVEHRVRGVRLSGNEVGAEEWLQALAEALTAAAATETRTREALARLLS
ncbi:MAG: hypothetical protein ACYCO3_01145 [Mycobacteriales bacterium]